MAERVTLQWNVTNWITVVLMAAIGTAILGCVVAGVGGYTAGKVGAEGSR